MGKYYPIQRERGRIARRNVVIHSKALPQASTQTICPRSICFHTNLFSNTSLTGSFVVLVNLKGMTFIEFDEWSDEWMMRMNWGVWGMTKDPTLRYFSLWLGIVNENWYCSLCKLISAPSHWDLPFLYHYLAILSCYKRWATFLAGRGLSARNRTRPRSDVNYWDAQDELAMGV